MLDEDNMEGFKQLTGWYSTQSSVVATSYSKELRSELESVLARFKKDVEEEHPYAKDAMRIHLRGVFVTEA